VVAQQSDKDAPIYIVVHPLHDEPEAKCDPSVLGPMALKGSTRVALMALRAYLVIMAMLVFYHVLGLTGAFR
jgi:hypothetical protein